jgi:RHS repeat-associated protein
MRRFLLGLASLLVLFTGNASAQDKDGGGITPMCVEGCGGGGGGVSVTPDGQSVSRTALGTFTQVFSVQNLGPVADTYELYCSGTAGITCVDVSPSSLTLPVGDVGTVTVTYGTGSAGLGTLALFADSPTTDAGDGGSLDITVTGVGEPVVSLSPYAPMVRSSALCVASCFDFVYARGTPSYTSLNVNRAFAVVYNSAMHRPTPVIQLDVSYNAQTNQYPTSFKVEVRKGANLLTLQNGTTAAYYQALAGQTTRLAAVIDARANGLATGDHAVTVTVTAIYPGTVLTTTGSTRLVVLDETGSSFGAGVRAAGIQRIYFSAGSALVTEGDGSYVLYESICGTNPCAAYRRPGGSNGALTWVSASNVYRRVYMDSSYVEFNSAGRMTKAVDRFANTTVLAYVDTLLVAIRDPMGKEINLGYDASGKLAAATVLYTPGGGWWTRTTSFTMDASGRLMKVRDPDNYSDSLAYQPSGPGLLTSVWNRARARTDITYDAMNRLASIAAPVIVTYSGATGNPVNWFQSSDVTAWQPELPGTSQATRKDGLRPDSIWAAVSDSSTSPAARVRMTLDAHGAPLKIVDPYGATTRFTRDTASRVTQSVQPNGHTVNYTYTGFLLSTMVDVTLNRTENYAYTARNDLATITGNTVRRDVLYYSGSDGGPAGALKKVYVGNTATYPTMTNATLIEWHKPDSRGRDTVVTDSLGHATRMTYDGTWGNTLTTKDPTGDVHRVNYDARGQVDSAWAPLSGKTTITYGLLNQVLTQRTPFGYKTEFQYDPATLALVRLVDPKNQVYKWQYNALGQLTVQHDVADTTRADTLKYDLRGQLCQRVTRRGDAIDLTYDLVGRILTRTGPDFAPDSYRYDPNGLWSVAENTYAYDSTVVNAAGQVDSFTQRVHGTTWVGSHLYDTFKRQKWAFLSSSALGFNRNTHYAYSASTGRIDTLCFNLNCSSVSRNGDGLPTTVKYGNWSMTQSFSPTHQLSGQTYPAPLSGFSQTIARDSLDRVTSLTPSGTNPKVRKFTYDTLGRLLNACDKQGTGVCYNEFLGSGNAFGYDSAGNRIDGSAVVGAGNRVTTFRGWTIGYDVVGQVASKYPNPYNPATARQYVWDALGRLTAVRIGPDTVARFRYDALGRRVLKVTGTATPDSLWFVYNAGAQVLVDLGGSGATNVVRAEYGYGGPGSDQVLVVKQGALDGVLLLDPMIGSVRGVAAWTGGTLKKDYRTTLALSNPWGTTPADTGAVLRFRWAGREYDQETGLYYLRARYYDPQLGKFLSEDPIGVEGGINLYRYVGGDPVNRTDPSGEAMVCWSERIWEDGPATGGGDIREMEVNGGGKWSMRWRCTDDGVIPGGVGGSLSGGGVGGVASGGRGTTKTSKQQCDAAVLDAALSLTVGLLPVAGAAMLRGSGFVVGMVSVSRASGHLASSVPLYDAALVPSVLGGFMMAASGAAEYGAAQYRGEFSFWDAMSAVASLTPVGAAFVAGLNVIDAISACSGP